MICAPPADKTRAQDSALQDRGHECDANLPHALQRLQVVLRFVVLLVDNLALIPYCEVKVQLLG